MGDNVEILSKEDYKLEIVMETEVEEAEESDEDESEEISLESPIGSPIKRKADHLEEDESESENESLESICLKRRRNVRVTTLCIHFIPRTKWNI